MHIRNPRELFGMSQQQSKKIIYRNVIQWWTKKKSCQGHHEFVPESTGCIIC